MNKILKEKIKQYNFYHRIKLEENIYTRDLENEHFSHRKIEERISKLDFKNKKILDIGCRDGFFSFYAEKKGAKEIIGIDNNISKGAVELLIPYFNSRVKMYEKNLYDLEIKDFGQFDIILFFGVLYHLRDPFSAIKKCSDLLFDSGLLLIETATFENIETIPLIYIPVKDSPLEETSCSLFNINGILITLKSLDFEILSLDKFIIRKLSILKKFIKNFFWFFNIKKIFNTKNFIGNRILIITEKKKTIDTSLINYWYNKHNIHS
jgi:2-polyprenyl-3-methyl-5-hydroxy-6-metoxy-1,4-benzoquinol methylase